MRAARPTALRAAPDDAAERLTELPRGEVVLDDGPPHDGWRPVVVPRQPSRRDPRGYPGWVRADDVAARPLDVARTLLGAPYLWGGLGEAGLDCSALVHLAFRAFDVVVPRDAADQADAAQPVVLGEERVGDLWFFARPGAAVHHVGLVTGLDRMLHASDDDGVHAVVEERLPAHRIVTRVAAGRFVVPDDGQG